MKIKPLLLFTLLFFCLIHISSKAQSNESRKYLNQIGIVDSLYSNTLQEYREIYIQLPDYYNPEIKYPVTYILDGESLLTTVATVQSYYSGGFTPDMILVGIANRNNRTRDLTTSKVSELFGRPYDQESGQAANFTQFIKTDLIPYVEKNYPVTSFRTLIGHSYGGLFTINTLLNHPELFNNYIAIDPSLNWDDQKLINNAGSQLKSQSYEGKSLFMSLGGQLHMQKPEITIENVMEDQSSFTSFARANISFSNMLREYSQNGLVFEWEFYPNDLHGTIPYPSIMDGLIHDFKWYQMENTDKFNSPETSVVDLKDIINYRAEKLKQYFGYTVAPYPLEVLNVLGDMSLDTEQPKKAMMFFNFATNFYPNNPTAYDAISKYYESIKDYKKAIEFATKAYKLSNDETDKERIENLKKNKY